MSNIDKPKKVLLGNVSLTQWDNNGLKSYTMETSYKDKNEEWQTSKSFNRDELLRLKMLIDRLILEEVKQL